MEDETAAVLERVAPSGAISVSKRDAARDSLGGTGHSEGDESRRPSFVYLRHYFQNGFAIIAGDTFALGLSLVLAGLVRFFFLGQHFDPSWSWYLIGVWGVGAVAFNLLPGWGLGPVEELRRLTILLLSVYFSLAVVLFFSKQINDASRLTYALSTIFSLALVPLMRTWVKRLLVRKGLWGVPTVIYGAGETGRRLVPVLKEEAGLGYNPVSVFDDEPQTWNTTLDGVPVVGGTHLIRRNAPVAIFAMPSLTRARLVEYMEGALSHYHKVIVIPDLFDVPSLWVRPRDIGGSIGLEITSNLLNPIARVMKRVVDFVSACAGGILWIPLTLSCAALIWLSDREFPFFGQERMGMGGRKFTLWKLRTMVPDAERVLQDKLASDEALRAEWNEFHKLREDPRVTRLGRVLRRLSIDELPQLFNVLRGDMSLVGPRPLPGYHQDKLNSRIVDLRKRVRPGITGLWQVSGRSDVGTDAMERFDGYYVRNWSVWLDIVVLVRTYRAVVKGSGAY
ncbi:MAG: undecaprenyl-phosphate galactose phosphotransferase WbaP [Rhodothermales bacterium]|nr:undecaprenyl-phosphate galactose phosphotransferase WbaP [Rhodothermales bacterium]